jgi:hypothetical protein
MTYQIRFDKKCRDTWPVWQSPSQQLFVSKNDCEGVYPGTKLRYYAWGGGGGGGGGGRGGGELVLPDQNGVAKVVSTKNQRGRSRARQTKVETES